MLDGSMTVHWAEARFAPKSRTIATTAMIVLRCFIRFWSLDIDDVGVGLLRVDALSLLIFEIHSFGIIEEDAEWRDEEFLAVLCYPDGEAAGNRIESGETVVACRLEDIDPLFAIVAVFTDFYCCDALDFLENQDYVLITGIPVIAFEIFQKFCIGCFVLVDVVSDLSLRHSRIVKIIWLIITMSITIHIEYCG